MVITNTGTARLAIGEIAQPDEFAHTINGSSTLEPGASLAISIVFSPKAEGPRTGTLTIKDNAPGNVRTIMLSGTGV